MTTCQPILQIETENAPLFAFFFFKWNFKFLKSFSLTGGLWFQAWAHRARECLGLVCCRRLISLQSSSVLSSSSASPGDAWSQPSYRPSSLSLSSRSLLLHSPSVGRGNGWKPSVAVLDRTGILKGPCIEDLNNGPIEKREFVYIIFYSISSHVISAVML